MHNIEFCENSAYSCEAQDAVRYGFKYRKISEQQEKLESGRLKFCLTESSDILVFIAELIISGVTYDILKSIISKMWNKLNVRIKSNKDNDLTNIFTKEGSLHEFYTYIMEFHEKRMCITEKQEKYIKEEIIADYCGEQSSIIYLKNKWSSSVKERTIIIQEAQQKADRIIIRKK